MKLFCKFAMVLFAGLLSANLLAIRPAFAADPNMYMKDVVKELRTAWPNNRAITIVFHGSDVPAGYFKMPEVETFNAYPHLLHTALKARYPYAVINVIVTAVAGESSDKGLARYEQDVLIHKPDVVVIDYGITDRLIGLEESRKALAQMITKAKRQKARVILLTPTGDLTGDLLNTENPLFKQAQHIRRMALLNEVALADSYMRFVQHARENESIEDLMSNQNHPNRAGHEMVAEELMQWFKVPGTGGR